MWRFSPCRSVLRQGHHEVEPQWVYPHNPPGMALKRMYITAISRHKSNKVSVSVTISIQSYPKCSSSEIWCTSTSNSVTLELDLDTRLSCIGGVSSRQLWGVSLWRAANWLLGQKPMRWAFDFEALGPRLGTLRPSSRSAPVSFRHLYYWYHRLKQKRLLYVTILVMMVV